MQKKRKETSSGFNDWRENDLPLKVHVKRN